VTPLGREPTTSSPDAHAPHSALRSDLVAMRTDLVERLAHDGINAGFLQLLADVNAAIEALDAVPPEDAAPADRAVITDDGREIRLAVYTGPDRVASVTLSPRRALAIAGQMIAAASRLG
jgi:hypothetical protein